MKLTLKQAVDICDVLRSGKPTDIMFAAREGMSLDELVRRLARAEVAAIKCRCQEEIDVLSVRVVKYLNRADVKEVINNENLSYFRHPRRRASATTGASCPVGRWKFHAL